MVTSNRVMLSLLRVLIIITIQGTWAHSTTKWSSMLQLLSERPIHKPLLSIRLGHNLKKWHYQFSSRACSRQLIIGILGRIYDQLVKRTMFKFLTIISNSPSWKMRRETSTLPLIMISWVIRGRKIWIRPKWLIISKISKVCNKQIRK